MGSLARLARKCQFGVKSCIRDGVKSCFGVDTTFGFSSIRAYSDSASTGPPKSCVLLGRYGKIVFPWERSQNVNVFLQGKPLLEDVPRDRLYGTIDDRQPYKSNDSSRYLMNSGLYLPFFSKKLGKSYSGAFSMDNVVVIKDMGMFAYRELKEDAEGKWISNPSAGYNEYSAFLKNLISCRHPSSIGFLPEEVSLFFGFLDATEVLEEFVLNHSALMFDEEYGYILSEVWRILRKQFPTLGKFRLGRSLLSALAKAHRDCLITFQSHAVLNQFLPVSLKNPQFNLGPQAATASGGGFTAVPSGGPGISAAVPHYAGIGSPAVIGSGHGLAAVSASAGSGIPAVIGSGGGLAAVSASVGIGSVVGPAVIGSGAGNVGSGVPPPLPTFSETGALLKLKIGILLVDANRHGYIHSDESHLHRFIVFLPGPCANSLQQTPFTRLEVIQLLRYVFPGYLQTAFVAFWRKNPNVWEVLGLRRRNPIPSIFFAQSER